MVSSDSIVLTVVLTGITYIEVKYKEIESHQTAILLGYTGLIQQRIE